MKQQSERRDLIITATIVSGILVLYVFLSATFVIVQQSHIKKLPPKLCDQVTAYDQSLNYRDQTIWDCKASSRLHAPGDFLYSINGPINIQNATRQVQTIAQKQLSEDEKSAYSSMTDALKSSSFFSFLFGPEQMICYLLFGWALAVMRNANQHLDHVKWSTNTHLAALSLPQGRVYRLADWRDAFHSQTAVSDTASEVKALFESVFERYGASQSVDSAATALNSHADKLESTLINRTAINGFIIWAIPSIGFIGTVRGIGGALSKADNPENLPEIVGYLGVAFDTTLVALLLSIPLMLVSNRFDRKVARFREYLLGEVDTKIIRNMRVS